MGALSAGPEHPSHPVVKQLQHDFTQMVSAVHGPGALGIQLTLANFLQHMQAGLAGSALPTTGGLVNTSA